MSADLSTTNTAAREYRRSTHLVRRGDESIPCYCAASMDHPIGREVSEAGKKLALQFHELYERLAPSFGYETRTETRQFEPTTPNGLLMLAVCTEIAATLTQQPATSEGDGLARIHTMFRMLGLDRIEELPGWGWAYDRNTCSVEGMIENGTLIEHFDDWVGFRPSDNTSKQAAGEAGELSDADIKWHMRHIEPHLIDADAAVPILLQGVRRAITATQRKKKMQP